MPLLDAICTNCGLTFGAHRADSKVPDQCPEHEGWMDWPAVGVTTFRDGGGWGDIKHGTRSKRAAADHHGPEAVAGLRQRRADRDSRLTPEQVAQKLCSEEAVKVLARARFNRVNPMGYPFDEQPPEVTDGFGDEARKDLAALANLFTGEGGNV